MQIWNHGLPGPNAPNHVWEQMKSWVFNQEQGNVLVGKMVAKLVTNSMQKMYFTFHFLIVHMTHFFSNHESLILGKLEF